MDMNMENLFFIDYNDQVKIDLDMLLVAAWNTQKEEIKIFLNDKGFFEDIFENPYDAAWAASAGDYQWSDTYVYVDKEGYLTSFTGLDDETCPIDIDKIDISSLINELQEIKNKKGIEKTGGDENSISRAIQDALQEV